MTAPEPVLEVHDLAKRFGDVPVFSGVDVVLQGGEFVALLGESGVGKSTLLNCMAGLEPPSAGSVRLLGQAWVGLDDNAQARRRRAHLGFVFQAFHVLPHLTVQENVALPLLLLARPDAARVQEVLADVGLADLAARFPAQLSGGQLQRVAIARAVVHRPALILADEPTGNLDPTTAERVLALLREQVQEAGSACLMVTHSQTAARLATRVLHLGPEGIAEPGRMASS
jgi:putative ABC transport system ATP-binding protein